MREKYAGVDSVEVPFNEVLAYALQQSDNNASDILLGMAQGAANVSTALRRLGSTDIHIVSSEAEMHAEQALCYANTATPMAMAELIDRFDREFDDPYSREVKHLLETCQTGAERLVKPLRAAGAVTGHKTGTGFTLPDGRLMAVNDVGYVHLPDGQHYTIAVFLENSGYSMAGTEALIAEISKIVLTHIVRARPHIVRASL